MSKKSKKLNKTQERRLKELDRLQRTLEANAEISREGVRARAQEHKRGQMRDVTDKVLPVEQAYKKARKEAEKTRDRAIRAANKAFAEAEGEARAVKREALATIEEEIDNLNRDVEKRIADGDAEIHKDFNEKLQAIVKERQEIRGGDEPEVQDDVPNQEAVPAPGPAEPGGEAVGVQ